MSDTNVSNVVPFRKQGARSQSDHSERPSRASHGTAIANEAMPQDVAQKRSIVVATLLFLMTLVRAILYGVMLWLRGPIKVVLWLAAATMWVGVPMMYFGMNDHPEQAMLVTFGIVIGVGATALRIGYDPLMAALNPR